MRCDLTQQFRRGARWLFSCSLVAMTLGCQPTNRPAATPAVEKDASSSIDRVSAGPAVRKSLQLFTEQPGHVTAFEEAPILSKLAGYVQKVTCDIGDSVKKGQVLMVIHAPEYKDQLEQKRGLSGQAAAQVKQAEAALIAAEATVNSAKALVTEAEAGVGKTEADYARWQSELNRIEQLVSKGSVTRKLADETTSQLKAADAARKEALANIESAKARQREAEAKILTARADIDAAKARHQVAQADIAQAETMLTYTELIAPFDGYVTSRRVDAGHYVQPAGSSNTTPLMTIANVSKIRIFVNVPESEAAWVDAGMENADAGDRVTVALPSLGKPIETRVTRTSLQLDPQSHTLSTEIDLDNVERKVLPGSYVTAKILLEQRDNVLVLPIGAIVKSSAETHCCIVVDGKIEFRAIELGLRVGEEVEILSGLDGSETIVKQRAGALKAGQPVKVM